jgi:hypothetical protein
MKNNLFLAIQVVGILLSMTLLIAPLFVLAKDEKPVKSERKIEVKGNRISEKIKDEKKSKGTNVVWKTGREFPTMFVRRVKPVKK